MKNKINKYKITAIFALIFGLTSCDLDINVDPNNPSVATPAQLLPISQVRIANSLGQGSIGLSNGAAVWMHQNVQRTAYDQYGVTGTNFAIINAWDESYQALKDLETIITAANGTQGTKYAGIAKIMKAYLYSEMVDTWGDIPFSEANKGAELPYPKFDDDATIYPSLITLLDEGIVDIAKTDPSVFVAGSDLIYGGNVTKWRKLAKTLKLKLYTNMRLVSDVKAPIAAIVAEGDLISSTDDFELSYGTSSSPENRNPGYTADYPTGRTNYVSPYFYEILTGQNTFAHGNTLMVGIEDPRVPYYFYNQKLKGQAAENKVEYVNEVGSAGKFLSIFFGSKGQNQGFDQSNSQTLPGLYFAGGKYDNGLGGKAENSSGKGSVALRMLPYFNRMYLQAELAITGTIAGDAKEFLTNGINASFAKLNAIAATDGSPVISAANIKTYLDKVLKLYDAGDDTKKLEIIMTQKWIASYGFSVDAYTDYRRTGFPKLYDPSADNPGIYAPEGNNLDFTARERDYPLSFPWKLTDLTLNQNSPKVQKIVTTYKVFWMK
jgi:hypothetical protein